MKLLPFIGSLLISTAPVQASKTFDEITEPCRTSEAAVEACFGTGLYYYAWSWLILLCDLRDTGEITPKVFAKREEQLRDVLRKEFEDIMWNEGVKTVLEDYPNCPIKPIP